MLRWRKMRWWSKLPILLTVALVMANAQCFAQCLTQPDHSSASHCHQHGSAKAGHCVQQHDLRVGSAAMPTLDCGLVALVELPDLAVTGASWHAAELLAPSPPVPFGENTPLPLRV
jgi:hypothetical protein